jgi:WD40 repeat protein
VELVRKQALVLEEGGVKFPVWDVAWSPNRAMIAAGGGSDEVGMVQVWRQPREGEGGSVVFPLACATVKCFKAAVTGVVWLSNQWVAASSLDSQVCVFHLSGGGRGSVVVRLMCSLAHPEAVSGICVLGGSAEEGRASDGDGESSLARLVGPASGSGGLRRLSMATEASSIEESEPASPVVGGMRLLSEPVSDVHTLPSTTPLRAWTLPCTIATACLDGRVRLWGGAARLDAWATSTHGAATCITASRQSDVLAMGHQHGEVDILQTESGGGALSFVTRTECRNSRGAFRRGTTVVGAQFHPRGKALIATTLDSRCRIFVTDDDVVYRHVVKLRGAAHERVRTFAKFCPHGRLVACGSESGAMVVWELAPPSRAVDDLEGYPCSVSSCLMPEGAAKVESSLAKDGSPLKLDAVASLQLVTAVASSSSTEAGPAVTCLAWRGKWEGGSSSSDVQLVACGDARGFVHIVQVTHSSVVASHPTS